MSQVPAGWYPDPHNALMHRFWDGRTWTAATTPSQASAPAGADGNTGWIWLIVLLPILPTLLMLFIPWEAMYAGAYSVTDPRAIANAQMAMLLSPAYVLSSLLGWVGFGLSVFFAYRDYRELQARQIPRPVHWAWSFLGSVYPIARSVVVKRRIGRGLAPLWVSVGVLVFGFIVAGVISARMMAGMSVLFLNTLALTV